jgi:poly(3-hydroxybutyrate) depolymerase
MLVLLLLVGVKTFYKIYFQLSAMKKILVSIICVSFSFCLCAQLTPNSVVTATNGTIYFYQYKPPHYNNTDLFPLIISLHGVGQAGNPGELINVLSDGIPLELVQGNQLEFTWQGKTEGFVLLAPQTDRTSVLNWPTFYVDEMVTYGINNLRVDPNRIFLTGFSTGGGGVWKYAASSTTAASKLAGIVPAATASAEPEFPQANLCNNISPSKTAIWAFHGGTDNEFPYQVDAVNDAAVNNCSPVIPGVDTIVQIQGHHIYQEVAYDFGNDKHYPNIFQWMLKVNRGMNLATNQLPVPIITGSPVITLLTPVKLRDFPVLDGSASYDPDDIIMDYLWEQTGGPNTLLPSDATSESIRQFPTTKILPAPTTPIGALPGTYTFRLRVKDYLTSLPGHTQFATLAVNVQLPASGHSAPAVDAGDDHLLTTSETYWQVQGAYTLYGSAISSTPFNWRFLNGPATAAVNNYNGGPYPGDDNNVRFVNMDTPGSYSFEFSITNNFGETGRDTVVITRVGLAALPVSYTYFNGQNNGKINVLSWATTSEVNSSRFDIMRSTDGLNFTNAGTITAKGGSVLTTYTFNDNNPPFGTTYYRLLQVDKDGKSSLSKTISVNNRKTGLYIEKYPNPAHDNLTVTVQGSTIGAMQVIIADMQGKAILQQKWQKNLSLLKQVINISGLQNGVYQIIISVGQEKQVSSFIRY